MATKTINIALPDRLLKKIDARVKSTYGSRSEYFRTLSLRDIERVEEWRLLFDRGNARGKALGIKSERDVLRILKKK